MTAAYYHARRALVVAGLVTLRQLAPRADWIALGAGLAFAATMRVVDRVHCDPAHRGANAAPALRAGLADRAKIILFVANLTDGGPAIDVHFANFSRSQPQLRVGPFTRQQLNGCSGSARDLRAFAREHLDAMDRGPDRDIAQRQSVTDLDRRLCPAYHLCPCR